MKKGKDLNKLLRHLRLRNTIPYITINAKRLTPEQQERMRRSFDLLMIDRDIFKSYLFPR